MAALAAWGGCRREPQSRPAAPAESAIAIGIPSADAPIAPLVFSLTRTRLLRTDQTGHERPALVERWQVSDDHLTWTFSVRKGTRLHDGREATAAEMVSLLRRATATADSRPGLWPVRAIELASAREVRVRLSEPTSLLLEGLSLVEVVAAGPYRSTEADAALPNLQAVSHPPQPEPAIRTVTLRRYDTPRAAVAALLRDDVDVLYEVPNDSRDVLASEQGVRIYPYLKPYVVTLGLNHRHPVLSRREVRVAMNMLVDRAALVAQELSGVGVPAADPIWLQHWSKPHTADQEALRVDRDRARRLLDAAALPVRQGADGRMAPRFTVKCLVLDEPTIARVAGRLQQLYGDAGIALELESAPLETLLTRLASGEFQTFLSPIVTGYGLSLPYLYFADHGHARMIDHGYRAASAAAERVRRAATDDAFAAAVADLHRVLLEDPPAVHLYWQQTSRAVGPRVDVPADSDGDILGSLPRWKIAEAAP